MASLAEMLEARAAQHGGDALLREAAAIVRAVEEAQVVSLHWSSEWDCLDIYESADSSKYEVGQRVRLVVVQENEDG